MGQVHEGEEFSRAGQFFAKVLPGQAKVGQGCMVIGVGIGQHVSGVGAPSDPIYLNTNQWSAADEERAMLMKKDLGFFAKAALHHLHGDEYSASE